MLKEILDVLKLAAQLLSAVCVVLAVIDGAKGKHEKATFWLAWAILTRG